MRGKKQKEPAGMNPGEIFAALELLEQELLKDPVKTVLVDMTPLGLVEITRKKVRKTLKEQAKAGKIMLDNFKPTC